ncbi:hypothetical protein M3J09_002578 [Ascochyta lentis]
MSNETEPSLSQEATHPFRSSPPALTQNLSFELDEMDASNSEPVAPHDAQQTPERPEYKRINSDDTARPASAQHDRDNSEEHSDIEAEHESSENEDSDPATQIANFDWNRLHDQYHIAINNCSQEEAKLMQDWSNLMEFFRVWAESGHAQETDRTFQRLQTRTKFVLHEEQKLEDKRNHYINVVRAFESALNLLKAPGLRG